MRHTWINNPTRSKRLCTRCGIKVQYGVKGVPSGQIYTLRDGTEVNLAPKCENRTY